MPREIPNPRFVTVSADRYMVTGISSTAPCRGCGLLIEPPATVCSDYCYSEVYGESKRELYEDERHAFEPEDEDNEESED